MDIGCQLPMQGPVATRDALVTFARQAEAHGMASLWVSDHVVFPYTSSGYPGGRFPHPPRSEEHMSELQSQSNLVCRLLLEKKKKPMTTKSPSSSYNYTYIC